MDSRRIVVVVEDLEVARTALLWALHNILRYGDVIVLLHVFPSLKTRNKNTLRLLRLKGFQLALSFKEICTKYFFNVIYRISCSFLSFFVSAVCYLMGEFCCRLMLRLLLRKAMKKALESPPWSEKSVLRRLLLASMIRAFFTSKFKNFRVSFVLFFQLLDEIVSFVSVIVLKTPWPPPAHGVCLAAKEPIVLGSFWAV